jgi:hypothetical protein
MVRVVEYYNRVQGFRGRLTGLPEWARVVLFIAALPGIALIALSILAFLVSLAALLLLTVPLYRLLKLVTGTGEGKVEREGITVVDGTDGEHRKRVEATVVE